MPLDQTTAPILIVDDEPDNLLILTQQLREAGYRAITATGDPHFALRRFAEGAFALVLLDIMMPGLDGFAVMARMQAMEAAKACPILVLTALRDEKTRLRALQEGARDFLVKPFLEEELLCRVGNLLEMHLAQRCLARRNASLAAAVDERTAQLEERNRQLLQSQLEILARLGRAAEFRDNETGFHVARMSRYAERLGQALGLDETQSTLLGHCAPMHDIGKVGIPDAILLKPGKLDPKEWAVMCRHPEIGANILACSTSPWLETSRVIALSHHERWDGTGYPQGLRGEAIPLFGRIVAVADVFDALTSARPYKPAWPVAQAVTALQAGCGTQFEPALVTTFVNILEDVLLIRAQHWDGETE
ncbi:MAG: response regulator [Magnetococcales bacterium]|nr:response regulator [Magnetococcales bacterium]